MFRKIISISAAAALAAFAAEAQDAGRTILVMDGSGSMWGQIDGKAKITIAQEVVGGLLSTLPEGQELGLTVYGHRRKGDCSDIQTVVAPGPSTRSAIADAVNAIKPKGKTPMTDAVIAAAEALKYTEDKATVILISDGIETCNPNVCEAARALEEAGVDFTAHVVGFDVRDPAAIAQMQCLANETGGTFRTADSAAELSAALAVVAEPPAPEPEPEPVAVVIYATDGRNGPRIADDLIWDLSGSDGGILSSERTAWIDTSLVKGEYVVSVLRPADEASAELRFGVGTTDKRVVLELPEYRPAATLEAPAEAPAGSMIQVRWTGPDAKNDYISVSEPESRQGSVNYAYTQKGPVLDLPMPAVPGEYELRYMLGDGRKVLTRRAITVTPVSASLAPPDELPAGATVLVDWTGPGYDQDYIAVTAPGEDRQINYSYTREGSPLEVTMPAEPGEYDLVYFMSQKRTVLARRPITVTGISYALTAPDTAVAGSTVRVEWTGPDYASDVIAVADIGAKGGRMLSYTYTREGSPLDLELPLIPGRYAIRYVLAQDRKIAAATQIEVTPVSADLTGPETAAAGSTVRVEWTGPDYRSDIAVAEPDAKVGKLLRYTYTREGSPLEVEIPSEPGDYVLRYIAAGKPRTVLAEKPLRVEDVTASLQAPAMATAGGEIAVNWDGPDYRGDYVAIARPGKSQSSYAYTSKGSPLLVKVPKEPGDYEIRYVMRADRRVLATIPLTVE